MGKIDSRTLPVEVLKERRSRAVEMRLDGTSLKEAAAQCEMPSMTVIAAMKSPPRNSLTTKCDDAGAGRAAQVDRRQPASKRGSCSLQTDPRPDLRSYERRP